MKLESVGELRRDCTSDYKVALKNNTVRYFIEQVIKRKKEYGTITINGDDFEYQYGRLIDYPKKYINKKIKSVSGSGGYFLMSYELETE